MALTEKCPNCKQENKITAEDKKVVHLCKECGRFSCLKCLQDGKCPHCDKLIVPMFDFDDYLIWC